MKDKCEMVCNHKADCGQCGWNPEEIERRKVYIAKHGLTQKKDHTRGLILSKMRKKRGLKT